MDFCIGDRVVIPKADFDHVFGDHRDWMYDGMAGTIMDLDNPRRPGVLWDNIGHNGHSLNDTLDQAYGGWYVGAGVLQLETPTFDSEIDVSEFL